jgi:murein DD-endopeptidase MepM/ murein hydrolase activator NlpD
MWRWLVTRGLGRMGRIATLTGPWPLTTHELPYGSTKAGQLLGRVGNSGDARLVAPHLHFGISWETPKGVWWVRRRPEAVLVPARGPSHTFPESGNRAQSQEVPLPAGDSALPFYGASALFHTATRRAQPRDEPEAAKFLLPPLNLTEIPTGP